MKVLVTGSGGHLGEAIIRLLLANNYEYAGIDLKQSEFTTHRGSIADRGFVKQCMEGVDAIIHTATLHKPHVATHSKADFIETNLTGTLNLLEEAVLHKAESFIYTSTTSTFGDMLTPAPGEPAVWVTEETAAIPKNIYGVTKTAAEDLCQLFYRNHNLPCLVLKTSRFFPEEDDQKEVRSLYTGSNMKANELLYRRVDIEDAAMAHLLAIEKAKEIGFSKYIISATTPFTKDNLPDLNRDAVPVVAKKYPGFTELYEKKQWKMFPEIDRVYVNEKARNELNWNPKYDFQHVLNCLAQNKDYQSRLSIDVGSRGYHSVTFEDGPYPVH